MKVRAGTIAGLAMVAGVSMAAPLSAATINSGNFSLGFGKTSGSGYTTTETSGANSNVSGDFGLSVTVDGGAQDLGGPTFINRVLSDGDNDWSGEPSDFLATLNATFSGTPIDAAAVPNYQIQLVITSISIYAQGAAGAPSMGFIETSAGHEQAQVQQALNGYSNMRLAGSYIPIAWNPDDYDSAGVNQTRTFGLSLPSGTAFLDGVEVEGYITLTYDAVPEPALLSLGAPVALMMLRRRR